MYRREGLTLAIVLVTTSAMSGLAYAQSAPPPPPSPPAIAPPNQAVSEVVVTSSRVRSLEQFTPTGSRLNLSAKDTPATLDVVTSQTIATRGYLTAEEAADSLPGVTSGGTPGDLVNFHIRGFSADEIQILHNGIYVGPSDLITRPTNTYNLDSVQVLKGPASVLYGQGAIGGAINIVNKAVTFGDPKGEALFTYGDFTTSQEAASVDGTITKDVAARLDISYLRSDNYIKSAPSDSFDVTFSTLWRPTSKLDVQFSVDYLADHPFPYYGDPLVPSSVATNPQNGVVKTNFGDTLDKRTNSLNYDVSDYTIQSSQVFPQLLVKYHINDYLEFDNFAYFFKADRHWRNAETYLYDSSTGLVNRDRFFVDHQQDVEGDQGDLTVTYLIFGFKNKLNIGYDFSHLDFRRQRGFPNNDEVSLTNPNPGQFDPGVPAGGNNQPLAGVSPTFYNDPATFFEDIFYVTSKLKLVTGARYDYYSLDRQNFNPNAAGDGPGAFNPVTSFKRVYDPFTYRIGVVYDVNQYITPYASFTTGQDPVSTDIFIVNAGQNYSLSHSKQIEAGVKASAPNNRADFTLAVYDIERRNVLVSNGEDASTTAGSEYSKGVEASGDIKITDDFVLNANVAYDEATFGKFSFVDEYTGYGIPFPFQTGLINANGKEMPNAPKWESNVWASYTHVFGLPLEIGGGVQYVGDRSGDYANDEKLLAYTLLNAYATYSITPKIDVTVRGDNLTDKTFAQATDVNYEHQIVLGRPRYVEVDVRARF